MKKYITLSYLFIVTLLILTSRIIPKEEPEPWITIFVHGILGIDAKVCFANAFQFMTDQILHTTYAKTVEYMRADPIFTKNQAMQELDLHPVDIDNYEKGYASAAIARTYDHILSLCPIKQSSLYYTSGWSGLLSFKARGEDSKKLYKALIELREEMKKRELNPKTRIIGYSHGANVCLNLAKSYNEDLQIDELILLGAPIQRETEKLVNSPLFKKIYSFYSRSDYVQKTDILSSQQCCSKRVFKDHREFELPTSLTQIEIKIMVPQQPRKKRSKKIMDQKEELFRKKTTNLTKKSIIKGNSWWLKNMSPGHTELWFMAWTPRNYRQDFPLYPVPLLTITPYLVQLIEATLSPPLTARHLVLDIRPDHDYIILRHRYPKQEFKTLPFLSKGIFKELEALAMRNKPDNYTKELHNKHRDRAQAQAYEDRKKKRLLKRKHRGKNIA